MTFPAHSIKHVKSAHRRYQFLTILFTVFTLAAAIAAAVSGIQLSHLDNLNQKSVENDTQPAQEPAPAVVDDAASQEIQTLKSALASEKSTSLKMKAKIKDLNNQITALKKTIIAPKPVKPMAAPPAKPKPKTNVLTQPSQKKATETQKVAPAPQPVLPAKPVMPAAPVNTPAPDTTLPSGTTPPGKQIPEETVTAPPSPPAASPQKPAKEVAPPAVAPPATPPPSQPPIEQPQTPEKKVTPDGVQPEATPPASTPPAPPKPDDQSLIKQPAPEAQAPKSATTAETIEPTEVNSQPTGEQSVKEKTTP